MAVEKFIGILNREEVCTSRESIYGLESIPTKFLEQETVFRVGRHTVCHGFTRKMKHNKTLLLIVSGGGLTRLMTRRQ